LGTDRGEELVYGDLLHLFEIRPVDKTVKEISVEYNELDLILSQILTLFTSFTLACNGFDYQPFLRTTTPMLTTRLNRQDWVREYRRLAPITTSSTESWICDYESKSGAQVRAILVRDPSVLSLTSDQPKSVLPRCISSFKAGADNFVLMDPRTGISREAFASSKTELYKLQSKEVLFNVDEFLFKRAGTDEARRKLVDEWREVRKMVASDLFARKPWLASSANQRALLEVEEKILKAERLLQQGDLEYSVREVGLACEMLLTLIYLTTTGSQSTDLTYNDLLEKSKDAIIDSLGQDAYSDLEFIKYWRNNVSHPGRPRPTAADSMKVVLRGRLFFSIYRHKFV
jgi:hypothetical protein